MADGQCFFLALAWEDAGRRGCRGDQHNCVHAVETGVGRRIGGGQAPVVGGRWAVSGERESDGGGVAGGQRRVRRPRESGSRWTTVSTGVERARAGARRRSGKCGRCSRSKNNGGEEEKNKKIKEMTKMVGHTIWSVEWRLGSKIWRAIKNRGYAGVQFFLLGF